MVFPTTLPGGPLGTVTGVLLIVLGLMALVFPALVYSLLVMFSAIFALILSIDLIRSGVSNPGETSVGPTLQVLIGILGILIALSIIIIPYFMMIAAKTIFGVWAVLTGAATLLSVFGNNPGMERALNAISGLILAGAGLLILLAPAILTDYILIVIIGCLSIVIGIFSIWLARANTPVEKTINHTIYK